MLYGFNAAEFDDDQQRIRSDFMITKLFATQSDVIMGTKT